MNAKMRRVLRQLESDMELCGFCGKDITGAPDCAHLTSGSVQGLLAAGARAGGGTYNNLCGVVITKTSMRIGMEMLMDIPYLESLRMFDPSTSLRARDVRLQQYIEFMMMEDSKV